MLTLKEKLISSVSALGFMPFDIFMSMLLTNPVSGYYCIKNPFNPANGDFTTAPELSQVFGELIGLWLAETWLVMGKPANFNLVELGAGSGFLIDDILRTTKKIDGFHQSLSLHFVEINPTLQALQQDKVSKYKNISAKWYLAVNQLKLSGKTIVFSNEFFDAMPVKQYCYKNNQYYELGVVIDKSLQLQLTFMLVNDSPKRILACHQVDNAIYESSPIANYLLKQLIDIIKIDKGVILTIDYGYINPVNIASIRGFKSHQLLNIQAMLELENLSLADMTYNVNFPELQEIANENKVSTYNILTQKEFLSRLGFNERVNILAKHMNSTKEKENFMMNNNKILAKEQMGEAFKVMAISSGLSYLPNFTLK